MSISETQRKILEIGKREFLEMISILFPVVPCTSAPSVPPSIFKNVVPINCTANPTTANTAAKIKAKSSIRPIPPREKKPKKKEMRKPPKAKPAEDPTGVMLVTSDAHAGISVAVRDGH